MSTAAGSTDHARPARSSKSKTSESSALPPPILADLPLAAAEPEPPRKRYIARKPFMSNGKRMKPGDEVEEAQNWPRVESWVRAGFLNEVFR